MNPDINYAIIQAVLAIYLSPCMYLCPASMLIFTVMNGLTLNMLLLPAAAVVSNAAKKLNVKVYWLLGNFTCGLW